MNELGSATEHEMVLAFLQAEIDSTRFGPIYQGNLTKWRLNRICERWCGTWLPEVHLVELAFRQKLKPLVISYAKPISHRGSRALRCNNICTCPAMLSFCSSEVITSSESPMIRRLVQFCSWW